MPTYEYLCSGCGKAFEVFQKMSDEPLSSCPECGAPARRRISGGAGFLLKGDGFYITDHRSQDYRDKAAADEGREKPASAPKVEATGGDTGGSAKKQEDKPAAPAPKAAESSSGGTSDP